MTFETLEKIFERVFACDFAQHGFTVAWHAGEPMTLPVGFYREALARIERLRPDGVSIRHSIQTNATLVTPEWCEFIREFRVGIGVSIDGPEWLHDMRRKLRNGTGSHARTMRGIELLRSANISFHVIAVLTLASLSAADEIFEFFAKNGIYRIGFNIEEIEAANPTSTLTSEMAQTLFRSFFSRFTKLILEDARPFELREFHEAIATISRPLSSSADNRLATPFAILSVDHRGNFSTFSPELLGSPSDRYGDFLFGNVWTSPFSSMIDNQHFQNVLSEVQIGIARCRGACPYFSVCGGGAPANKFFETRAFESTETMYCTLTKKIICDVVLDFIEARFRADSSTTTRH